MFVAAFACLMSACAGTSSDRRPSTDRTSGWSRLPDPPLSPRTGGLAAWTGEEAIFLGGETKHLCPPNADCIRAPEVARDGAAYDPKSRAWRSIPDAPAPVGAHTPHAMVDDSLLIVGDNGSWHVFDENRWRSLPSPPKRTRIDSAAINADDGMVAAIGDDGRVHLLDLSAETWSVLPRSPDRPRLVADHAFPTSAGIVVIGKDANVPTDGTVPSFLLAEVYRDGTWRRLERSDMVGGFAWHWTGQRLVAPDLQCVDGGEVNGYGRCIPQGGRLDPVSGRWSTLPHAPKSGKDGWSISAADGPQMLAWGYLYDDQDGSWTKVKRPAGAPDLHVASTWADGTVLAFGGVEWHGSKATLSNAAWAWTPSQ